MCSSLSTSGNPRETFSDGVGIVGLGVAAHGTVFGLGCAERLFLGFSASDILSLRSHDTRAPWWLGLHLCRSTRMHVHVCLYGADDVHVWEKEWLFESQNTAARLGQFTGFCQLLRRSAHAGMVSSH